MNKYQKELQELKPEDEIQDYYLPTSNGEALTKGYYFIGTAGHGYLVVPKDDRNAHHAYTIVEYGYKGKHAYYLEEDSEMGEFLNVVEDKVESVQIKVKKKVKGQVDCYTCGGRGYHIIMK